MALNSAVCTLRFLPSLICYHPFADDSLNHCLNFGDHYTPQEGSQLATLGTFALDNPALTNMAPADNDNTFLQQLNEDWLRIESKPHVSCAYEKKPYKGAVVVGWSSSTRFCSEVPLAIDDEDHLGIAKPNRALHPSVVALKRALVKYALPIQMEAQLDTPDFQQKDDRLQFTMNAAQGSARLMNRGRATLKYWVANKSSPSLYIVPGESPQSIGGNQMQQVDFLLLADANDSSYDLTLKTDPELPQELNVKVVVSNLNEIRSRHASQVALMLNNVEAFLADQETASEFAKLPANDPKAMSKIAEVAFNSVTASNAALSDSAKWVIVADSLATARIGRAAGIAINKAEMGDATNADSLRNLRSKVEKLIIDEGVKADEKSNLKKLSPEDLKAAQPPRWLLTPDYVQGRDRLIQRMAEYPATRNAAIPINLDVGHAEIKPAVEKSLTYGGMSQRIDKPLNSSMQEGAGRPIKIPLTREKRILEEKKTLDFTNPNADRQLDEPDKRLQKPAMNRLNRE
ncbi:hypothetical protein ACN9MZ_13145 [Pseudoduganella sp. S-14]|uniref:hypothetical protein n=1 Tax=Pseudoduganella sp. S-14 TaxID=3404065 RepID=UPI003CEFB9E0